jgi:hypothetical protein
MYKKRKTDHCANNMRVVKKRFVEQKPSKKIHSKPISSTRETNIMKNGWLFKSRKRSSLRFKLALTDINPEEEYPRIINYVSVAKFDGPALELRRLPLLMKCMRKTPTFEAVYSSLWGTVLWFATNQMVITGNKSLPQIRLVVRILLLSLGEETILTSVHIPDLNCEYSRNRGKNPVLENDRTYMFPFFDFISKLETKQEKPLPIQNLRVKYVKMASLIRLVSIIPVNVVGSGPVCKGSIDIETVKRNHPQLNWQKEPDEFSGSATWVNFPIAKKPSTQITSLNLEKYSSSDVAATFKLNRDISNDEFFFYFGSNVNYTNGCIFRGNKKPSERLSLRTDIDCEHEILQCSVHIFPDNSNCVIMKMNTTEGVNYAHKVVQGLVTGAQLDI